MSTSHEAVNGAMEASSGDAVQDACITCMMRGPVSDGVNTGRHTDDFAARHESPSGSLGGGYPDAGAFCPDCATLPRNKLPKRVKETVG